MKKNYFNVKVYTTQEVVYLIKIDITYFHDISPPFLEKRKKVELETEHCSAKQCKVIKIEMSNSYKKEYIFVLFFNVFRI